MKKKITLFNLNLNSDEKIKIKKEINSIIEKKNYIRGKQIDVLKKKIIKLLNVKYCITTNSGTDSLYVALRSLNLKPNDEVITTSHSWISTSETIKMVGAKPVFVDTNDDFNINFNEIEKKITKKTKVLVVVHLFGRMVDCEKLLRIKKKYKIKIIEDCAQSFLSKYKNKYAGTLGDIGTFSFFPTKNLGSFGDAGCVITNDIKISTKINMLVNHGSLDKKDFKITGINSRMDTIQAAVLMIKIVKIKNKMKLRYKNFKLYKKYLSKNKFIKLPAERKGYFDSFYLLTVLCKKRNLLQKWLNKNHIQTGIYYKKLLPFNSVYNKLKYKISDFKNAYYNNNNMLSLPIHEGLTEREIKRICNKINDFYKFT